MNTPDEIKNFLGVIDATWNDDEVHTLEYKARAMDVKVAERFLDRAIDELLKHFEVEDVLDALTRVLNDLARVVGEDDADQG